MPKRSFPRSGSQLFLVAIAALFAPSGTNLFAQISAVPDFQIILFTPSDIQPPPREEYVERLNQFGLCAE